MSLYGAYETSKLGITFTPTNGVRTSSAGSVAHQLVPTDSRFVPTSFVVQVTGGDGTGLKMRQFASDPGLGTADNDGLLIQQGVFWRIDVDTVSEAFLDVYYPGTGVAPSYEITQITRTSGPLLGTLVGSNYGT